MTAEPKTEIATRAEYQAPANTGALTPMDMLDRAIQSGAAADTLEKLMALQERWEANQGRKAFDNAIANAKAEFPTIIKNREVDFTSAKGRTNYRHEDLDEIRRNIDPVLSRHGLSYRWRTDQDDQRVKVTCILSHRDGYSEETTLAGPVDNSGNKNALQAIGSASTYLFRYTLKAALGLSIASDDDGREAQGPATITAEQLSNLLREIEAAGADQEAFCKWLKVDALSDLPQDRFWDAVKALQVKRAKRDAEAKVGDEAATEGGDA